MTKKLSDNELKEVNGGAIKPSVRKNASSVIVRGGRVKDLPGIRHVITANIKALDIEDANIIAEDDEIIK